MSENAEPQDPAYHVAYMLNAGMKLSLLESIMRDDMLAREEWATTPEHWKRVAYLKECLKVITAMRVVTGE